MYTLTKKSFMQSHYSLKKKWMSFETEMVRFQCDGCRKFAFKFFRCISMDFLSIVRLFSNDFWFKHLFFHLLSNFVPFDRVFTDKWVTLFCHGNSYSGLLTVAKNSNADDGSYVPIHKLSIY